MEQMAKNYFTELFAVNVGDKIEKKNGLSYLSWAWAWAEIKKRFPDASYTVYERPDGVIYWTDGRTCWVKTGLTINEIEHIEYLPVMDVRNRSIPLEAVTSMDVNKAIQRSLTKAAARHGLGLYIYAGEDLPEDEQSTEAPQKAAQEPAPAPQKPVRQVVEDRISQILATDEQKRILRNLVDLTQLDACNKSYGEKWERMPANVAEALIAKCHRMRAAQSA